MGNNDLPLISVITVSYNASDTIEQTILSVINQSYANIEYIIIDGGSIDGTVDIINKYKNKITYWISEPDKGIYDAMNKGLNIAKGDWCIFLGADDLFISKNTINEIINKFQETNKIYYGDVIMKSTGEKYRGRVNSAFQLCQMNICHQSIFYPQSIYKTKRYNTKYRIFADYVYNMELYHDNPMSFEYINKSISLFNDGGISSTRDLLFDKERWSLIKTLFGKKTMIAVMLYENIQKYTPRFIKIIAHKLKK